MLTIFEYIKTQLAWLFVMGFHLTRYMGVGGKWVVMAIRLIIYGLLVTPAFAPHILWYMGSSTVIRRVRYRSSRKVKLEIVKALLQWKEAAKDRANGGGDNTISDLPPVNGDKKTPTVTNQKKEVEEWIERSFNDKIKARDNTASPAGKKSADDKAREERKSAMVEVLSDRHKQQQGQLSPSARAETTKDSETNNAAVLLRSIRAKLSFTDTILSKDQDDELENKYVTTTVNKTAKQYIPLPPGTTADDIHQDTQKAIAASADQLTTSPLTYFGDSRISRVFGNNADEDEAQPQLLASVNKARNASGVYPPISPPLSATTRSVSPALKHRRDPSGSSQANASAGNNIQQIDADMSKKPDFAPKASAISEEKEPQFLDDNEQDTLLFNYFQIFCEAYYKKKEALRQNAAKKGTGGILKKASSTSDDTTIKPTKTSIPTTLETLESCDRQATEMARESLMKTSEQSAQSGNTRDTSGTPINQNSVTLGPKDSSASRNSVSPSVSAQSNTQANNLEGGELSAATTPTKVPPPLEKPESLDTLEKAESEVDFESEAQVLDAFLEWVEEQCDTEDVRVHNRATLDVFVPIPLHDLLALRSSKFKNNSTTNLAKEVAISATEQKENLKNDGDSGAKPSTDANGAPTLPPSQLRALMKGEAKPFKVCILVSGGAWIIGCYLWSMILARFFAAAGYVVFVPDYRNFPQAAISGMVEDVTDAIVWVLKNAEIYHGDLSNVTVIGHSAGAHLSLLTMLEQCRACVAQEEAQKRAAEAPAHAEDEQTAAKGGVVESPASAVSDFLADTANTKARKKVMASMSEMHEGKNTENLVGQANLPTPVVVSHDEGAWSPSGEENPSGVSYGSDISKIPVTQAASFGNRTMLSVFNELKHEMMHNNNNTNNVSPATTLSRKDFSTTSPSVTPRNSVSPRLHNTVTFAKDADKLVSPALFGSTVLPASNASFSAAGRPPLPTSFHSNTKPRFNPNKSIKQWIGVSGIYDLPSLEGHFNKRGLYSKVLYALAGYWGDPSDGDNRSTALKDGAEVQKRKDKLQQDQEKEQVKAMAASGTLGQPMSKKSVKQSPLSQTASTVFPPGDLDDTKPPTMGGQRPVEEGFETPLKALRRVSPWWLFVKESPIRSPELLGHKDKSRKGSTGDSLDMMSTYALFSPNSPMNRTASPSSMSALTTLVPDSSLVPYLPRTLKFLHGTEDDSAPMEESAAMVKVISEASLEYGNELCEKISKDKNNKKKTPQESVDEAFLSTKLPSIHNVVFLRASHTDPILEEILCGKCTVLDIAERSHVGTKTLCPRRREDRTEEKEVEKLANSPMPYGKQFFSWLHAVILMIYAWSLEAFGYIFGDYRPHFLGSKRVEVKHEPVTFTPGDKSLKSNPGDPYDERASSPIAGHAPVSPGVPSYYETSLAVDKDNMPRLIRWARKICPF